MSAKLLINGKSGSGKTSLLKSLKNAFVISRDGKAFPFSIPHMLVKEFYNMDTLINGNEELEIEGTFSKLEKFKEKTGDYPDTIVIDSSSKILQDIIDHANLNFTNFDIHSYINKEVSVLTKFVQEDLVNNDFNVVIINHVMDNDKKGLVPVGQGKFKDKGGFYGEVDHSILIDNMKVIHRGVANQARTTITDMPTVQYVENFVDPTKSKKLKEDETYYNLQEHIDLINSTESQNGEWEY